MRKTADYVSRTAEKKTEILSAHLAAAMMDHFRQLQPGVISNHSTVCAISAISAKRSIIQSLRHPVGGPLGDLVHGAGAWCSMLLRGTPVGGPVAGTRRCRWHRFSTRDILVSMIDVTQIVARIEQGDPSAAEQLLPLVYEEPGKIAAADLVRDPAKGGDQVLSAGSCRKT